MKPGKETAVANKRAEFLVGTSGWSYPHWKGVFYPEELPGNRWFAHYAEIFPTVEVNATFYRFFKDETYLKWRRQAPARFRYVLKAPGLITHRKYLKDAEDQIGRFWRSAVLLQEKLGLILLQLAPRTPYDPDRLERAVRAFGDPRKVAVEFRDPKWLTQETKERLTRLGSVFCSAESPKSALLDWVTSPTAYIRLHGREGWYRYNYSDDDLREIAALARHMGELGAQSVYIFFNNDAEGFAPGNARTLARILAS
ncbi:MAG: DUF72 domain-containing protein [Fidelibacterota bacterium]